MIWGMKRLSIYEKRLREVGLLRVEKQGLPWPNCGLSVPEGKLQERDYYKGMQPQNEGERLQTETAGLD